MQQLDTNQIFAKNIIYLRTKNNMTQLELAEKLNYSDKAVSRWERAEAIPDAKVLIDMSEIFGVSIDNLLKKEIKEKHIRPKFNIHNFNNITWISFLGVWTIALLTFVILWLCNNPLWLVFVTIDRSQGKCATADVLDPLQAVIDFHFFRVDPFFVGICPRQSAIARIPRCIYPQCILQKEIPGIGL